MKANRTLLFLTALAAGAAACREPAEQDPGGQTPYEELHVTADTSSGYGSDTAAPVTAVQGGTRISGPLTATGNLRGLTPDAPPGAVTVHAEGEETRLLVNITRYTPGTELQASVASGTCDAPGEVVHRVPEVFRVGPDGIATLRSRMPIRTAELLGQQQHSIRVTNPQRAGTPEVVLACAELPTQAAERQ